MTANDINSYLDYLDGLVDEYNICICSVGIKAANASYSALPEVLNQIIKFLNLMFLIEQELQKYKNIFCESLLIRCLILIFGRIRLSIWMEKNIRKLSWERINAD